MRQGTLLC